MVFHRVLRLYRNLLKEGKHYYDYNLRNYIIRRTTEDFRRWKNITEPTQIQQKYEFGLQQLEIVKRQKIIQNMYYNRKKVIET